MIRGKNVNRVVIAHLNISSLRNKFHILTNQIKETKLETTCPDGKFKVPGYVQNQNQRSKSIR